MNRGENTWDKEQSGDGGEHQASDNGAAQRGVFFTTFAQTQRHGDIPMIMASAVMSTSHIRV